MTRRGVNPASQRSSRGGDTPAEALTGRATLRTISGNTPVPLSLYEPVLTHSFSSGAAWDLYPCCTAASGCRRTHAATQVPSAGFEAQF